MKTNLTVEIEQALINRVKGSSKRYATEVSMCSGKYDNVGHRICGIVDFVTAEMDYTWYFHIISCYEIKISYSDFKSKHGHSLFGDKNYYVITKELYEEIMKKNSNLLMGDFGVYVYNNKRLRLKREINKVSYARVPSIEERFLVLDNILMRLQRVHHTRESEKE
jgi:hypothetical protein